MDGDAGLNELPAPDSKAYKALGNAVNVNVVSLIAEALVGSKGKSSNSANNNAKRKRTGLNSQAVMERVK